jgi:hypothetical protein
LRDTLASCGRLADVTELTTVEMMRLVGWSGVIHRSSDLRVRSSGRSERLADLASAVGATTYLCGTGGSRYLDPAPFKARELRIVMFKPPRHPEGVTGYDVNRLTGLSDLAEVRTAGARGAARRACQGQVGSKAACIRQLRYPERIDLVLLDEVAFS